MRILTIIALILPLLPTNPSSVSAEPTTPAKPLTITQVVEPAPALPKRSARPTNPIPRRDQQGQPLADDTLKLKVNSWTIGLPAGQLEAPPLRFATGLAGAIADGDHLP